MKAMRSFVISWIGIAACLGCSPAEKPADTTSTTTRTDTLVTSNVDTKPIPSTPDTTATPATPKAPATTAWTVGLHGIGPIEAGMTIKQAIAAADGQLATKGDGPAGCAYLPLSGLKGVGLLADNRVVGRVDVDSAGTSTAEGAQVGDSEAHIKSLYGARVTSTPHKYEQGGHYLTVRGTAPADSAYRLIFETNGKVVTRFRSGKVPVVERVERCG